MKDSFSHHSENTWVPVIKIGLAFFVVAGFQIFWHWFLSRPSGLSQSLLRFYLSYDPVVGKGVSGWFDMVLPCICLGLFVGWVDWNCSVQRVVCVVILIAIGLAALLPLYTLILNKESVWWWPKAHNVLAVFFVMNIVKGALMTGVFAYGGRCFGIHFKAGQIN